MSIAQPWTIKCLTGASAGTEHTLADWGIGSLTISRKSGPDVAKMTTTLQDATVDAVFSEFDQAAIYYTDPETSEKTRRFVGVWTKTPRDFDVTNEAIAYELTGIVYYYLSTTPLQMDALSLNASNLTIPATISKPSGILGLAIDGSQTDMAASVIIALDWCLTVCAAQTTSFVPYSIGTLSFNDTIVPYEQVENTSCWQYMLRCMGWCPDVTFIVDYSEPTTDCPVSISMKPRSTLSSATLPMTGGVVSKISKLTPRYDLKVGVVVLKYDTVNTIDGKQYFYQQVDQYPTGVSELTLPGLVAYVNLAGGHITSENVMITTTDRPISETDSVALPWCMNQADWLWKQTNGSAYDYDVSGISVLKIETVLDPNDPAATDPPAGFVLSSLVEELLTGEIKPWMLAPTGGGYAAKVTVTATLKYTGNDAKTLAQFTNGQIPSTYVIYAKMKATSLSSGPFSRLTSTQGSEPVPEGLAELMYNSRSVLHYEGSVELLEQECSGSVTMGNVLNISGGRTEWASMNAQIVGIDEMIDTGVTRISVGPPKVLGISELMDLKRVFVTRAPAWNADAYSTGIADSDQVNGHMHAHHTSHLAAPSPKKPMPWDITFRTDPTNPAKFQFMIPTTKVTDVSGAPLSVTLADGSWNPTTSSDQLFYIQAAVSSLSSSSLGVLKGASSGGDFNPTVTTPWATGSKVIGDGATPPNQTKWRIPIATVDWTSGYPVATNVLCSHLTVFNQAIGGYAAVYPRTTSSSGAT
jgi:hypothetical protein